jgi:3-hydroxyisobutyrate dehydrogenase-like beta-hydroxyacid dehydrogenase
MGPTVVVIAMGEMGSGVARRLVERGATVRTSLAGRSAASAERAKRAGVEVVNDDRRLVEGADILLSIVPPGDARGLAERLAPALAATSRKPIFLECNAVSPERVAEVEAALDGTGCPFVDAGIIGGPPAGNDAGPRIYVSGEAAPRVAFLRDHGLDLRVLEGRVGVASALKMSYASLTKGLTAIGAAMMLGAMRAGVAPALKAELAESQSALLGILGKGVPRMYPKAYRWVAEMEEIAHFMSAEPAARDIYNGTARLYEHLAADVAEGRGEPGNLIDVLDAFLKA